MTYIIMYNSRLLAECYRMIPMQLFSIQKQTEMRLKDVSANILCQFNRDVYVIYLQLVADLLHNISENMWSSSRHLIKRTCDKQEAALELKLKKLVTADGSPGVEGSSDSTTVMVSDCQTVVSFHFMQCENN